MIKEHKAFIHMGSIPRFLRWGSSFVLAEKKFEKMMFARNMAAGRFLISMWIPRNLGYGLADF